MEGAAQTLLSNAGQLLSMEYQQLRGVGGDVAELRDELDAINALLLMQSEAEDGAVDRFLHVCMRQLGEVAYDAEDCIDLYNLRIRSRPTDGVRAWLGRLLGTLPSRRRLACEIRALRARTLAISERQARFGVNRDALRRSPPLLPAPMTVSAPANDADRRHRLVGIAEQADKLAARLKAPVGDEGERKAVFSIVGFGGLGKTTLAMEVCRRLEAEFPWQGMVSVSQAFEPSRDLKVLLTNLLRQVVKPETADDRGIKEEAALGAIDDLDDNGLAKRLEELLVDKRYLIVIDDVWTVRTWEAIQSKLPENNKGSRVIVTTRIETVANACSHDSASGHCIHKMQPLKLEDSKKLFVSRVFGSLDVAYPKEFEDVMSDILKKCGGLPLAIISIASVLVGYKSPGGKDKWDRVCKSLGSQMEIHPTLEGMKHIVTLSYNHLPHELKGCMMYFSIFPEDYVIRKGRLLNRWMAEGLVHQKRGLTTWEVAESYLDELLSRNMIEEAGHLGGYAWREQTYRVHDMLLEVMVSKSLEANFLSLHGGQYKGMLYDKIRRLSIHADVESVDSVAKRNVEGRRGEDNLNIQHVRALSMFQLHGQHKLLKTLGNFVLLRVLDLEDCEGITNKHVRYACNLYLLRFLSLRATNISMVPRQIGNLEHLQTLDLGTTLLTGLPKTITKLEKLEYILFSNKDNHWGTMWTMPRGINKMKALHVLRGVSLGDDSKVAQEVGELEELEELEISININKAIDEEVLKELALSISKMHSLRWLSIGQHGSSDDGVKILNFLHDLPTPPRLLRVLWITSDIINGLPSWIGSLAHLVSFTMLVTTLTDDKLFGVLCMLPNLKTLYMDWDCYRGDELAARTIHKFPVLRDLILGGYLPKVIRFEEGSMAMLEMLELRFDRRSRHVAERSIVGIEHLTNLKKVMLECRGDYHALVDTVLEQMKAENDRRSRSNQFQIAVKYW
ncbi:disease resistance protein Pik-2-like isoform X1 [Miscanthus floridulus]|uniref:disease resistance protein Pik-2-like isoform X1 n=1 Tax=Miscanthus floridulus TaxID=154761 RepID=UPI0034597490